jgi:glycerophosphoryl diester phosphodiesterase
MDRPTLVAHRGYAACYPENSLEGLRAAVDAGARWLEFDVQMSADGVPVLLHDATLQRTAGRPESVFDMTAAQLCQTSIGEPARLGERFSAVMLPSLAEVAAWLANEPGVQMLVEVKTESIDRFGIERVQGAVWKALQAVRPRSILISYDDAFLFAARLTGSARIGWILSDSSEDRQRRARALAPDLLLIDWTRLPQSPTALWRGPWIWATYEVTDPQHALELAARGIGFVETMDTGRLLADRRLSAAAPDA